MSEKIEGTITLDGLIEGRFYGDGTIAEKLKQWTAFTKSLGLRFNLEISGNSFSILPDAKPLQTALLGTTPEQSIVDVLEQLLGVFPSQHRGGIFSTLRSAEIRKGQEVQAVYPVGPDGAIKVQTRVVEANTSAPPEPLAAREQIKRGVIGLLAAAALLGGLSLFIDLPAVLHQVFDTVRPLDPADITVDAFVYTDYFEVEDMEVLANPEALLLTLQRSSMYPVSEEELIERLTQTEPDAVAERFALEALLRGYVRCELFDTEDHFVAHTMLRVRGLQDAERVEVAVSLPQKVRIGRIALTY